MPGDGCTARADAGDRERAGDQDGHEHRQVRQQLAQFGGPARHRGGAATRRSGRGRSSTREGQQPQAGDHEEAGGVRPRPVRPARRAEVLSPRPAVSSTALAEQDAAPSGWRRGLDGPQQGQRGGHRRGGDDHRGAGAPGAPGPASSAHPPSGPTHEELDDDEAGDGEQGRLDGEAQAGGQQPAALDQRQHRRRSRAGSPARWAPSGARRRPAGRTGRRRPPAPCPRPGAAGRSPAAASRVRLCAAAGRDDPDEDGDDQPADGDGDVTERAQRRRARGDGTGDDRRHDARKQPPSTRVHTGSVGTR